MTKLIKCVCEYDIKYKQQKNIVTIYFGNISCPKCGQKTMLTAKKIITGYRNIQELINESYKNEVLLPRL